MLAMFLCEQMCPGVFLDGRQWPDGRVQGRGTGDGRASGAPGGSTRAGAKSDIYDSLMWRVQMEVVPDGGLMGVSTQRRAGDSTTTTFSSQQHVLAVSQHSLGLAPRRFSSQRAIHSFIYDVCLKPIRLDKLRRYRHRHRPIFVVVGLNRWIFY